jgi:putative spermidine/putrescine transport system permease protein
MAVPTTAPIAAPPPPGWRTRLAERGVDRSLWLLLPGLVFVLVLFVYPFLYGLQLSLRPLEGGGMFADYRRFFSDPFYRDTIWKTLRLAIPAVLINVVVAVPLAYWMRDRARGRHVITAILVFPITLGTVLLTKGLLNFLGPRGWLNRTLLELGIVDQPVQLVQNYWGVLIALIVSDFPFVFLLMLSYAAGIDPSYERAAATLGAGAWERFRRVILPMLAPGLAITTCLAFVLAFGVFPSAILVGQPAGSTRTIGVAAYREGFQQFDFPMASAIAMIMAAVELIVILTLLGVRARRYPTTGSGRKG